MVKKIRCPVQSSDSFTSETLSPSSLQQQTSVPAPDLKASSLRGQEINKLAGETGSGTCESFCRFADLSAVTN